MIDWIAASTTAAGCVAYASKAVAVWIYDPKCLNRIPAFLGFARVRERIEGAITGNRMYAHAEMV